MGESQKSKEELQKEPSSLRADVVRKKERMEKNTDEENFRQMALFAELYPAPVLRFNADGEVLMANAAAVKILKLKFRRGMCITEILPGIKSVDYLSCITKRNLLTFESPIGEKYFQFVLVGVPDISAIHIYSNDITQIKEFEKSLRQSEEKFRAAVGGSLDDFFLYSAVKDEAGEVIDFKVEYVNEKGLRDSEETLEQIKGKTASSLQPGYKTRGPFNVHKETFLSQKVREDEVSVDLKKRKVWYHRQIIPMKDGIAVILHDITERKQFEEKLKLSDEILSTVNNLILVANEDGDIIYASPSVDRLLGFNREEVLGDGWWKVTHESVAERVEAKLRVAAMASGKKEINNTPYESNLKDKEGRLHFLLWQDAKGAAGLLVGVAHDITEIRRAELVQTVSYSIADAANRKMPLEELYPYIHEQLSHIIDTKNLFIALYDAEKETLNFPYFVDENYSGGNYVHSRKMKNGLSEYLIRTGKPLFAYEDDLKELRAKGKIGIIGFPSKAWMGVPLKVGEKNIGVLVLQSYDNRNAYKPKDLELLEFISAQIALTIERQQEGRNLRESEEKYRELFERSRDAIYISNVEGKLLDCNESFMNLFGYSKEESHKIQTKELYVNLAERFRFSQEIEQTGSVTNFEVMLRRKDGTAMNCLITSSAKYSPDGKITGYQGIVRDITQRKQIEETLRNAKQIAEESLKVKEQFLANVSHEIRTPMNTIIGMTHLLLQENPTTEQAKYLNALKISADNLLQMVNQILDISKIQAGKMEFEKIEFVLRDVLEGILQMFWFKTEEKKIKISLFIDEQIPSVLIGDPIRLNQILINLTGNAVKFTPAGEVRVNAILRDKDTEGVTISFSVVDTGIGISEDKLSGVFESFTQASSDTTKKYGGTGLGLTITKQLVELQGGEISVTSSVDRGSVFSFTLKYGAGKEPSAVVTEEKPKEIVTEPEAEVKILLVEDNQFNQVMTIDILHKWSDKIQIDSAYSGPEAIEKLQNTSYDIVLMDIQMPEMDGYETTRRIRKNIKLSISILALTANAMPGEAEKCISAGMNDYISKPFVPNDLYIKIQRLVQKSSVPKIEPNKIISNSNTMESNAKSTDLTYLKSLYGNDTQKMHDLIRLFLQQTPVEIEKMRKLCEEKNWNEIRAIAHTLKPRMTFMGIHALKETIKSVEEFAEQRTNLEKIPEMISKVISVCGQAYRELETELAG